MVHFRSIFQSCALAVLLAAAILTASGGTASADERLAIKGYDPVAYFTESRPVQGKPEFVYTWDDAQWRFASVANRDTFAAAPDRYAPQYAGYCAYGMALGVKVEIDPQAWAIVDGRLYLNSSTKALEDWRKDQVAFVQKADRHWPSLKAKN